MVKHSFAMLLMAVCSVKNGKTLLITEDQKSNYNFALHQCQTLKRCALFSS